jgi:hypothetical protein
MPRAEELDAHAVALEQHRLGVVRSPESEERATLVLRKRPSYASRQRLTA